MSTYAITATIWVDDVKSPSEAATKVREVNELIEDHGHMSVQVQLPDSDSGYVWSKVS